MEAQRQRKLLSRATVAMGVLCLGAFIAKGFVPEPIPVTVGSAVIRDLEVSIEESAKTRVRARYVVSAPVLGHLARIALKVGDSVEAGSPIAEIAPMTSGLLDDRTHSEARARVMVAQANIGRTKASVKRAEAAVAFARDRAQRQRALSAENGTPRQALDEAEFAERVAAEDLAGAIFSARVAEQELVLAKVAVDTMSGTHADGSLSLTAPVAGRVLRLFRESEGVVQPGTPLVEVGDPGGLEIVVDVLTTDAVKIAVGAQAVVERWGGDQTLKARVRAKEPAAFTTRSALGVEEQRVAVLLDLMEPKEVWSALGDGFRVEARIRTALFRGALVAPSSAVFRRAGHFAAFVVGPDNRAHETTLETGARTPEWVEIKGGLQKGARLVAYPSDQVLDGVRVTVTDTL